jgi:hypothetical protein
MQCHLTCMFFPSRRTRKVALGAGVGVMVIHAIHMPNPQPGPTGNPSTQASPRPCFPTLPIPTIQEQAPASTAQDTSPSSHQPHGSLPDVTKQEHLEGGTHILFPTHLHLILPPACPTAQSSQPAPVPSCSPGPLHRPLIPRETHHICDSGPHVAA